MRNAQPEFSVTLTPALYQHLKAESERLDVPLEWLVASLVLDSIEEAKEQPRPNRRRVRAA